MIKPNKQKICFLIKGFTHILLVLLLFLSGLHLSEHHHSADDGYSICNPECDSTDHHSITSDCEDCLNNNNQKSFFNRHLLFVFYQIKISLNKNNDIFNSNLHTSHFLSRAPPTLL